MQKAVEIKKGFLEEKTCLLRGEYEQLSRQKRRAAVRGESGEAEPAGRP